MIFRLACALLCAVQAVQGAPPDDDVLQYVDPLIGSANGGMTRSPVLE